MGKRKITILKPAVSAVAEIAFFVESKGMPETAKKFVQEVFNFFEKLSDDIIEYRLCRYLTWKNLGYRCTIYKKKYIVAFLRQQKEIIICNFVFSKLLK